MGSVHRIDPGRTPGIRRIRSSGRFRYLDAGGRSVDTDTRARITALAIPPAWTRVWISPDPDGHIQAMGTDAAGRRQYLYHPGWRTGRDRRKFARALELARVMPQARTRATRALHDDDAHRRALGAAFRLLDRAGVRIGSPTYLRRHGTRGLVTLRWADLSQRDDEIELRFRGKLGRPQRIVFRDAELAEWLDEQPARPPRATLLRHRDGARMRPLTPQAVNAFVHECTGGRFTAKDFRTLRGTIAAAESLAAHAAGAAAVESAARGDAAGDPVLRAVDDAAGALGNTRAVARASYIDPRVFREARRGRYLDRSITAESALLRLLEQR